MKNGFSVLEVILAVAIFITFSTGAIAVVVQGYNANRLGTENTVASQFASEGIEAVKSIKNQGFANLVNTTGCGLTRNASNVWAFQTTCTNNTLIHNSGENYTRLIKVEDVNRDANGNIVAGGGTLDPDTKKITSTVTWNFNSARPETTELVTYLSDWKKPIVGNGLIMYGNGTTTPKFRIYETSTNNFEPAIDSIAGASGVSFAMRTSPTKLEAVAGYITDTGTLQIMCFDGTAWSNEWSIAVGGTGTTRRFDISYETGTGDVMVVYSRNVAASNALSFRTKQGSAGCGNWTAASDFASTPSATTGTVQWVRMARDPGLGSNTITVIWADSNSDLGANNWSGTAWATGAGTYKTLETNLERVSASQDVDNFEVVYESLSGNVMVVWGNASGANGTNGARYSRCTGGVYTCIWSPTTSVPNVSDDIHNIDMTANPESNQIVYAAIGNEGDDLTAAYWSGSAWTGYANLDTSSESPIAGSKKVSTAWLINSQVTRWILNYDDASGRGLSWFAAAPGSNPVRQSDFNTSPLIRDIRERYDADMDPVNKEQAMVTLTDSTRAIFAKRVSMDQSGAFTWTNADGGTALDTIPAVPQQGFSFMYWRNQ